MSEKVYDGYDHVKRLNAETTEEELLQIYSAWSKSFDKVIILPFYEDRNIVQAIAILANPLFGVGSWKYARQCLY